MKPLRRSFVAILLPVAAVLVPAAAAPAQTTLSFAHVLDFSNASPECFHYAPLQPGPTSATCPPTNIMGGTGSASAAADNIARSVSVTAQFTQGTGPAGGTVESNGETNDQLHISNYILNEDFVFHFAATLSGGFTSLVPGSSLAAQANFFFEAPCTWSSGNPTGAGFQSMLRADGQTIVNDDAEVTQTASGFDVRCRPRNYATGTVLYDFFIHASDGISGTALPPGDSEVISLDAAVSGIDVINRGTGALDGSFTLDPDGGATFVAALTTTPEPTTLALALPGLVGVMGLTRLRRRR